VSRDWEGCCKACEAGIGYDGVMGRKDAEAAFFWTMGYYFWHTHIGMYK